MKHIPFRCLCNQKSTLIRQGNFFSCRRKGCFHHKLKSPFPIKNNIPIIISEHFTDTISSNSDVSYINRALSKMTVFKKIIIGESKITKINCSKFVEYLFKFTTKPKVLIVGGAEKGSGTKLLWENNSIEIHSIDIYGSETVDLICDAHYLPLANNFYHGVWIQAVLEHVIEPHKVVNEIFRVLKVNGVVYAETPFMQQVHEGAFDFNRFTVLGHRYLFKKFKMISIGGNKGPEVVFAWSLKYLFWSIFRSKKVSKVLGIIFTFITRPLSFFVSKESMFDASSGVFFLGKKILNHSITHKELIKLYKGQFK